MVSLSLRLFIQRQATQENRRNWFGEYRKASGKQQPSGVHLKTGWVSLTDVDLSYSWNWGKYPDM